TLCLWGPVVTPSVSSSVFFFKQKTAYEISGKTIAITPLSGSVAAGNTVIVTFAMDPDAGTVSCADSKGNTYSKDADQTNGSSTSGVRTVVFSAPVTTALASGDSITVTLQHNVVAKAVSAAEFSGLHTVPLDKTATATGSSTAASSGSTAATAVPIELLVGAVGVETQSTETFTAGSGYTLLSRVGSATGGSADLHITISPEFRTVAATGAYAADGALG